MSDVAVEQKIERLENRVEELEDRLDSSPDSHISVWADSGPPTPGSGEVATLIKRSKGKASGVGVNTNKAMSILGRKKKRTLEIMKEIGDKHPDLVYSNGRGNKASRLMRPA